MNLKNIQFKVNKNIVLKNRDKEILLEAFRMLFNKKYGYDIVSEYFHNENKYNSYLDFEKTDSNELLMIYDNDKLIGASQIKYLNNYELDVLDVAINGYNEEEKRKIWKLTINYALNYFKKLGYKKMYLEIPVKDPFLLSRADDLGFKEDSTNDINYDLSIVYLYSKELNNE